MQLASALLAAPFALCAFSSTAAAQWGAETPLTDTGSDLFGEAIASSGSTVHVVYGANDLHYLRSTDEGETWSEPVLIGSGTLHLTDPMVADGDDVWLVYLTNLQSKSDWCCAREMGNIWLRHSADGGDTWDDPVQLSTPKTAFRLSIAYAANRLHLVWMDYRAGVWDTYYLRSPDRGATWDPEVRIAQSTRPFGAERPQVAARGDSVHVTLWDDRGDNASCKPSTYTFPNCPDVFHMRSVNGGESWSSIVNVGNGGARFAGRNDIAVAGSSSVVINYNVDVEGETGSKLFAVASKDNGATWETPIRLTTSANGSDHGSIIGAGNSVYLAWHDDRDLANREVYFRYTPNGGKSWEDEEQVSSGAAGDSSTPLDVVTPGYFHVIWIDDRDGSYQVYYRRRALPAAPQLDGGVESDGGESNDASDHPDGSHPSVPSTSSDCGCALARRHGRAWPAPLVLLVLGARWRRRRRSARTA